MFEVKLPQFEYQEIVEDKKQYLITDAYPRNMQLLENLAPGDLITLQETLNCGYCHYGVNYQKHCPSCQVELPQEIRINCSECDNGVVLSPNKMEVTVTHITEPHARGMHMGYRSISFKRMESTCENH